MNRYKDKVLIPLFVFIALFVIRIIATAQDYEHVKIYAGYSAQKPEYGEDYIHGVELGIVPTIVSYRGFNLQGATSFASHFKSGGNNNVQLMAGPQISF